MCVTMGACVCVLCVGVLCVGVLCVGVLCVGVLCVGVLCVGVLCVGVLCVGELCVGVLCGVGAGLCTCLLVFVRRWICVPPLVCTYACVWERVRV